ncbi:MULTISPECIES: Rieske 2Fe-2S domain-containing protein [Zoogloea]|uniref:Rieske (2Fe-2S) protein n=1 Tax=Zoogloea TaxID=349 RepID=UPI001FE843C3|nr:MULTISPECIES: Rieske 2Fe-2S domain-containing protein [Zoogloea]MDD2667355.1 Rieske 2Fe-2S domain-containing protein [Zoogloea sp.]
MICLSEAVREGEDGVRFTVTRVTGEEPAFVVRFGGRVYAYFNRCAHVPIELDWQPGRFFDDSRLYLICATHGALYEPESGRCVAGPCRGAYLKSIPVVERDGGVFLVE